MNCQNRYLSSLISYYFLIFASVYIRYFKCSQLICFVLKNKYNVNKAFLIL